ncbi:MAG: hypothetical protein ABIY70_05725 [Capsulimonas sp.]|jgi:hypothetical protein|uniref:hypothetical protein n=1 Tax=Capsulimonas sp. TaxID=2494211 RepID=UPI003265833F|nr:hypothetical protein [Capsulimonas sp.]
MPTVTAPYIETQQVVTGYMYQLHIAENENGPGITRLDIGPYYFPGAPPQIKYPEAVTNEMCPPSWQAVRWFTDESGASWLRWQGGRLLSEDGEQIFQLTSNYPSTSSGPGLHVWRGNSKSSERYSVTAPDYSQEPPKINPRHDVIGKGSTFVKGGCAPVFILGLLTIAAVAARCFVS